jgi:hypothetical protein
MAIGWIEHSKSYPVGEVDASLISKVNLLRADFRKAFPHEVFRGLHRCSLCVAARHTEATLEDSHINLFIPLGGFVFVAPGRIDHHMEVHRYLPPESFIGAVMNCPSPLADEYFQALKAANRGFDAPLSRSGG